MATIQDEFDTSPLSWVKREIDSALTRAREGFTAFCAAPENHQELVRTTLPHFHQVTGALRMIGLEPASKVAHAIETLVETLSRDDLPMNNGVEDAVLNSIKALGQYLEGLMQGESNRPLTLFPAYRGILIARGSEKASEIDLFYPDLMQGPTFADGFGLEKEAEPIKIVKQKRTEYQRSLLNLLRTPDHQGSLYGMGNALSSVDAVSPADRRSFWWIAGGYLEGLAHSATQPDNLQKQLCGRIDLQIKRQIDAGDMPPEGLIRELLLAVAYAPPVSDRVKEIQDIYRLKTFIPLAEGQEATRIKLFVNNIKEQLEATKDMWANFSTGNQASLEQFTKQTAQLNELAKTFNNNSLQSLFAKLAEVGAQLSSNKHEPGQALILEIATLLLITRDALNSYPQFDSSFDQLVKTINAQVSAALAGEPLADSRGQLLDISWATREKQLIAQVGQEIMNNLNDIEQVLDGFFRDPSKRGDLAALNLPINQVQGAFTIMENENAVQLLKGCRDLITKFGTSSTAPDTKDSELVAEAFSNLGLFVAALQHGQENTDKILQPILSRFGHPLTLSIASFV